MGHKDIEKLEKKKMQFKVFIVVMVAAFILYIFLIRPALRGIFA